MNKEKVFPWKYGVTWLEGFVFRPAAQTITNSKFIESFNGHLRRECPNGRGFLSSDDPIGYKTFARTHDLRKNINVGDA